MISLINFTIPGYVLYGFEEIAQWHAESNSSISVNTNSADWGSTLVGIRVAQLWLLSIHSDLTLGYEVHTLNGPTGHWILAVTSSSVTFGRSGLD